ncbi:MAG: T9SS type A sorting domain-containing protein [Ignavibacteriales bacterium]|nr:T9SS type A sorting domain-containing protein [Ignavibacteriales bacterium]
MHTTDAGANWEFQSEGSENTINSIDFLDPMIGTAVGDSGLILRTEDGGDTWIRQFTDQRTNLNDLYFLDTIRGWIVGDDGTILQTLDAGQNWVRQDISHLTTDDLYSIEGTKRSNKVAGQNGAYLISNNEPTGATWGKGGTLFHTYRGIYSFSSRSATLIGDGGTILLMLSPPSGIIDQSIDSRFDLRDIYFPPGGIGWIVGKYGIVLKSTFLGGSWKIIDTLPVNWLNSVYFYDTLNGFTAGSFGSFYRTSNSGYDWVKIPTGVTNTFKKSYFFDQNNGWLVGTYGLLMKTTNGGGTGTPTSIEEKPAIPVSLELQQNYPNPFNPVTTINFVVPDAGNYRLTVYDILGNETGTLHEGFLGAGSHFVSFDGNNYASGVYFYRLSGNGQNLVRKMVLLK